MQQPGTYRVTFSAILFSSDPPRTNATRLRETALCHLGSIVGRTVINDNQFAAGAGCAEKIDDHGQRRHQPRGFVVSGHDDGERGQHLELRTSFCGKQRLCTSVTVAFFESSTALTRLIRRKMREPLKTGPICAGRVLARFAVLCYVSLDFKRGLSRQQVCIGTSLQLLSASSWFQGL